MQEADDGQSPARLTDLDLGVYVIMSWAGYENEKVGKDWRMVGTVIVARKPLYLTHPAVRLSHTTKRRK